MFFVYTIVVLFSLCTVSYFIFCVYTELLYALSVNESCFSCSFCKRELFFMFFVYMRVALCSLCT